MKSSYPTQLPPRDPEQRSRQLNELLRELQPLRQEDRKTGWLRLERERRETESDRPGGTARKSEWEQEKAKVLAPLRATARIGMPGDVFGGGENGRDVAAFVLEV